MASALASGLRARMGEPFKNWVSRESVTRLGSEIASVDSAFDVDRFINTAAVNLEPLELKARVRQVADALRAGLPPRWATALATLVRARPAAAPNAEGATNHAYWWPALDLVERHGLDEPELSLEALPQLTTTFSAEFAVRPYIARWPALAWSALQGWCAHPDLNVRRLASEGSRPRLPWGMQLRSSVAAPAAGLSVIERLVDDSSEYVRRSVANHLGDVGKDHPALAIATARRWMAARADRQRLVRHALRTLLKRGDSAALALFGEDSAEVRVLDFVLRPNRARTGEIIKVTATLFGVGAVRTDVLWEMPGARSGRSRRIFRGGSRVLTPGEAWNFQHSLSLIPVSTRVVRAGEHRVWLRVNGRDVGPVAFDVA